MKNTQTLVTINGLMDGISVLETNNCQPAQCSEDILYNDQYTNSLDSNVSYTNLYRDECYAATDIRVEDFGQAITLTSTTKTDCVV